MLILIVRSIFCPNEENFTHTFNALFGLFSFLDFIDPMELKFSLYLVGWCKKIYSQQIQKLVNLHKDKFNYVKIQLWNINYIPIYFGHGYTESVRGIAVSFICDVVATFP